MYYYVYREKDDSEDTEYILVVAFNIKKYKGR